MRLTSQIKKGVFSTPTMLRRGVNSYPRPIFVPRNQPLCKSSTKIHKPQAVEMQVTTGTVGIVIRASRMDESNSVE